MTDCIRKARDVCLHAVFGHGAASDMLDGFRSVDEVS